MSRINQTFRGIVLLFLLTSFAGCKEVLYSNLTEREANRMVAVLEVANVPSLRSAGADGTYEVLVEQNDIAIASTLLEAEGLPQEKFKAMDQIFAAEGLVGTPFEERVRYVFALEQKLTESLVGINGVRSASVSINIPEQPRFGDDTMPSTASVILHSEVGFDQQDVIPKIKIHLSNAVPNLEYGEVAVVVFPTGGASVQPISRSTFVSSAEASTSIEPNPDIGALPATVLAPVGFSTARTLTVLAIFRVAGTFLRNLWRGAIYARKFNARL